MSRKEYGFQPMELESGGDHDARAKSRFLLGLGPTDSSRSGTTSRPLHRERRQEQHRASRQGILTVSASILAIALAALVYRAGKQVLIRSGILSWDNPDEYIPGEGTNNTSNHSNHNNDAYLWLLPPTPHREEEHVAYLGVAPLGWDPDLPRQSSESTNPLMDPPVAVPDPYGWLRDDARKDSLILDHLQQENNYTRDRLHHLGPLKQTIYQELLDSIQETSFSFPVVRRSYFYYTRTIQGAAYPLYCRAPQHVNPNTTTIAAYLQEHLQTWDGSAESPLLPGEHVYLDPNRQSLMYDFYNVGQVAVSPSEELVAYTLDVHGNEIYQLIVMNAESGHIQFSDSTLEVTQDLVWPVDEEILYYAKSDDAERTYQVYQWNLTLQKEHLLFEDLDVTYWVGFYLSQDRQYLLIESASSTTSEAYYLDLFDKDSTLQSITQRRPNVLYEVEHLDGYWWILSNVNNSEGDMQLWTTPVGVEGDKPWTRVLDAPLNNMSEPLLEGVTLEGLSVYDSHYVVLEGREGGSQQIWVVQVSDGASVAEWERLELDVPASVATLSVEDTISSSLFLRFSSLITPAQVLHIDLEDLTSHSIVHEQSVPNYDKSLYGSQQLQLYSRDGTTMIPVSLVYRKETWDKVEISSEAVPIHMYAYGAYGVSVDDTFAASRLPLLDRGILYAIVHVRGGGELGRPWYLDGKLLNKHNTFDDFVDVAVDLIHRGWTTADLLSCEGRSAGGLTIGASVNQAPELFRVAILGVPFVDLVVTMMDASIPLTTGEWEEWGNPNEETYFSAMMDYSPMNNVKETMYPSMLLLAGLNDPRVAYWEPAKLTATLRYTTISHEDRPICLKTDLTSGHFSASDRYKNLEEKAFDYAFLIDQLGLYN
eukprot:Nitzschia sp. Nitz4//scaffold7_size249615//156884//159514//NITZ4_001187-RA/size249615-processed-gene-0.147-mRNA-1//1//CDS//3329558472//4492//frame0